MGVAQRCLTSYPSLSRFISNGFNGFNTIDGLHRLEHFQCSMGIGKAKAQHKPNCLLKAFFRGVWTFVV